MGSSIVSVTLLLLMPEALFNLRKRAFADLDVDVDVDVDAILDVDIHSDWFSVVEDLDLLLDESREEAWIPSWSMGICTSLRFLRFYIVVGVYHTGISESEFESISAGFTRASRSSCLELALEFHVVVISIIMLVVVAYCYPPFMTGSRSPHETITIIIFVIVIAIAIVNFMASWYWRAGTRHDGGDRVHPCKKWQIQCI